MDDDSSEIHSFPALFIPVPQCRRSIRSDVEQVYHSNDNSPYSQMKREFTTKENESFRWSRTLSGSPNNEDLSTDGSNSDAKMTKSSDKSDEEIARSCHNRSRTTSPERRDVSSVRPRKSYQSSTNNQTETTKCSTNYLQRNETKTTYSFFRLFMYFFMVFILVGLFSILSKIDVNKNSTQSANIAKSVLFKTIEDVKSKFHNQESDIWNDISSGINEVVSRTPKVPSIILLFGNETATMDCLAKALADASSTILGTDSPLYLNPEDFGDDPGEIIDTLNKRIPTRKAVIIRNVLNINAKAIKALHNLCDRINPLVGEAIYIITMPTKIYIPWQKKLAFVEKQIYNKLSRNIDEDILMALITRITDGAIVSVQPEPNLRYC